MNPRFRPRRPALAACRALTACLLLAGLAVAASQEDGPRKIGVGEGRGPNIEDAKLLKDLRRAEQVHRSRLGRLRRLYLLAVENGWDDKARIVLDLAATERLQHARLWEVAKRNLRAADFAAVDKELSVGRERRAPGRDELELPHELGTATSLLPGQTLPEEVQELRSQEQKYRDERRTFREAQKKQEERERRKAEERNLRLGGQSIKTPPQQGQGTKVHKVKRGEKRGGKKKGAGDGGDG